VGAAAPSSLYASSRAALVAHGCAVDVDSPPSTEVESFFVSGSCADSAVFLSYAGPDAAGVLVSFSGR
jgi:hypothetical protein